MSAKAFQIPVTGAAARLLSRAASRHGLDPHELGEMIVREVICGNPEFAEQSAAVMRARIERAESGHVTTVEEIMEQDRAEQARFAALG